MTETAPPDDRAASATIPTADEGVEDARLLRTTSSPPDAGRAPYAVPPRDPPETRDEAVMTLVGHLAELRRRVAIAVLSIVVGTAIGFLLAPSVITLLVQPVPGQRVAFFTLTGGFYVQLKIGLVIGFAMALPVVLYQLWAFVSPGLTPAERRAARPWVPLAIVFFLLGVAVAYVTLPYAVGFLVGFQTMNTFYFPTAEAYFGFVTTLFLAFGVVMQFPIALVLLSKLGVLSVDRLRASRRYVFLGVFVFAVVATPGGDPVSPVVLGGTMYLLYEGTILLLRRLGPAPATSTVEVRR